MERRYETFEHGADMGIRGYGETLDNAFENAAMAMFSIMVDTEFVGHTLKVDSIARSNTLDNLLVEFLNDLLLQKDLHDCMFSKFVVDIVERKGGFDARYRAYGEKDQYIRTELKTEVKGATFTKLAVGRKNGIYYAQCIVDV